MVLGLFTIALVLPKLVNVERLSIFTNLWEGASNADQGLVIVAAFKLVLMNSLRAVPLYMAVFYLVEEGQKRARSRREEFIYIVLALSSIPLVYELIHGIHQVRYNFGMPAYLIIGVIFFFARRDWHHVTFLVKLMFITLLLLGFQWLDIIPALSPYGFGLGEVSRDVKMVAEVIGATEALTFSAIVFFLIFFSNGMMILKIMTDQSRILQTAERQKAMEAQLTEARIQNLKARSIEEQQHLVHDLKSPLTSIQGLVSVSEMMVTEPRVKDYMGRVSRSVDQLNVMISEILNENKQQEVTVVGLFDDIMAQLSSLQGIEQIVFHQACVDEVISVNRIRFSRMIINIVSNSLAALPREGGQVRIGVEGFGQSLRVVIGDNGCGIDEELMDEIWTKGFSTKGSFGLGLTYIQSVVVNHGGDITMESTVGEGTRTTLVFPLLAADKE